MGAPTGSCQLPSGVQLSEHIPLSEPGGENNTHTLRPLRHTNFVPYDHY